ncbi:MAG TPA: glycosyltransferase [Draconibacterium sp.]|nr:glycosyltransferase [Draconibacterium sp.]
MSILVIVRNDEENIRATLPHLLTMEGVDYEVVAVDDFSQDSTLSVLGLFKQRYEKLKITSLSQETRYSEKLSQNIALKLAQNEWVLIYPACAPNSSQSWLDQMCSVANEQALVKVSYTTIAYQKSWYNKLYRIENFFQQIRSASYIMNGAAFLYNEENVAFKKSEYFSRGGFGASVSEPYANLELVLNRFIKKKNTELSLGKESSIVKNVSVGWHEIDELLRKSIRIEKKLKKWKQFVLAVDRLMEVVYPFIAAIALLMVVGLWPLILALVVLKELAYVVIIKILQNRLNERKLFITSLVFSLVMPYYKFIHRWHFNRKGRNKWKNKG